MTVALISNPDCGRHDTGWGHPEHVGRLRAIPRALRNDFPLYEALLHHEGRLATTDELALAHDVRYVEQVRTLAAAGGARLDADTLVSPGSWAAGAAGAGCVLDGVDMAFDGRARRSFAAVRPPGHHALRGGGMGFCLFGNVAVAAHYARRRHGAERVLIVDWDVHHGNGTQALVEHESSIRFVSLHQWPWYPGTGAAADRGPHRNVWNVPMAAGRPAAEYVDALLRAVDAAVVGFTPDLLIVSAGFDSLSGDPLGAFTLELEHVTLLTRAMTDRADSWCGGRLVSALEGGYAPERLGDAAVTHLRALAEL
ncbi:MAG: Acetylspermidine deacetylase; Deacetylases, including yeast histone deacetylase and acetoin utilization protein [uncultured Gemmatimonadaceae bacterium]|uniref:Acetylspermidine deacetylase Deacetylases, including yeast histone deacetylase and acetoin utilization protein n=1 Tax=uncultured Gemmatimonadaceae bacterium TaxID=246130 RepID=A0A6J4M659_9BACT|nr:MAG: Acetylspermidine deacetylase; Deacetylases, including yeast histone deacetylase and acetoin utilization protein [uncultured Gemmatimonadaceae bacterium]